MNKNLLKAMVVIMAMSAVLIPATAFADGTMQPMSVDSCTASISVSGTTVKVTGTANFVSKEASPSMYIELQQYKNGKWEYYAQMSPNKTGSNCYSLSAVKSFSSVAKGYKYRGFVRVTGSSTKSAYSVAVEVK